MPQYCKHWDGLATQCFLLTLNNEKRNMNLGWHCMKYKIRWEKERQCPEG